MTRKSPFRGVVIKYLFIYYLFKALFLTLQSNYTLPGKSLDKIAELREQNKLVEPFKTKKKKKKKPKSCNAVISKEVIL